MKKVLKGSLPENINSRVVIFFILAVAVSLLFTPVSIAHPHVFMEVKLSFRFARNGLTGIGVKWVFDEFFSGMVAGECDRNKNGRIEKTESRIVKREYFDNLVKFNYFTFIKIEGKTFKVKWIRDFSSHLSGGRLIYRFFIPCHVKAVSNFKEVIITPYDPTYYAAVDFADPPVSFKGGPDFKVVYKLAKNPKKYYYGMIHPVDLIMKFRRKNE